MRWKEILVAFVLAISVLFGVDVVTGDKVLVVYCSLPVSFVAMFLVMFVKERRSRDK